MTIAKECWTLSPDMNQDQGDVPYEHTFAFENGDIEVGVHYANSIHEPRIQWHVIGTTEQGAWGNLVLPSDPAASFMLPYQTPRVAGPQLTFGRFNGETPCILGESRDSIELPEWIARELREELCYLSQLNTGPSVSDDLMAFPPTIQDSAFPESITWTQYEWDDDERVMWYKCSSSLKDEAHWSPEWEREHLTSPRAYQIDEGELIWRKHSYLDIARPSEGTVASSD